MKIGIIFGGASREREISFAGGRTVYDNLDKSLFTPVPIFVDSFNNFILLDWQYIYKGTIRDFFPPIDLVPPSPHQFQIYNESLQVANYDEVIAKVGRKISLEELPSLIDFAFLTLHGSMGEDGSVQGLLQWLGIPYSGSSILPSSMGMDKAAQKKLMVAGGFNSPKYVVIKKSEWLHQFNYDQAFETIKQNLGIPFVIKPANQGSSVGATIITEDSSQNFVVAMDKAFFIKVTTSAEWLSLSDDGKINLVRTICDIREGVGLPLLVRELVEEVYHHDKMITHPEELFSFFENHFKANSSPLQLEGTDTEKEVLVEGFIKGKEFSCIVIQDENNQAIALPPTEIVKGQELFDYRSKYMPGLSRKVTPIQIEVEKIEAIRLECENLFRYLGFNVYARIDGFIADDGKIYLNDPNTTSGMLPSSFFFHQAAEIGLNPSQFLSYIICTSIQQRIGVGYNNIHLQQLLDKLNADLQLKMESTSTKIKVAVIMGGYSSERHISIESGRNIYEKLASSAKYQPIPVFLSGNPEEHELYVMPVNIMLKDNADDIRQKILTYHPHPVIESIKQECKHITDKYAGRKVNFAPQKITYNELKNLADEVFIALHGRPGEDGAVQHELEKLNLPYNGSKEASALITINKYATLQLLKEANMPVTDQLLVTKKEWLEQRQVILENIVSEFPFPIIAKPVDDGCSSAVKKIKNQEELIAFAELIFRESEDLLHPQYELLHLKPKEEFPRKEVLLIEKLISKETAVRFMEVTVGLLTHHTEDGGLLYEVFEPSETLSDGDVLSLEEKFLAGQGQNITPARFSKVPKEQKLISNIVKIAIQDAAIALQIEGYARIDAFVKIYDDLRTEVMVIEANSLPGMTPATCIYHQAAIAGYKPYDFIDKILEFGKQRLAKPALLAQ